MTGFDREFSAARRALPFTGCLSTIASQYDAIVLMVSSKDSPFFTLEWSSLMHMVVPPNLCIAAWKEHDVRVDGS